MTQSIGMRVYYEDTDAGGVVYYANYLKFIERARSEWVRGLGIDQVRLRAEEGLVFAVRRVEADYLRPGRLEDWLEVTTALVSVTGARIVLDQAVFCGAVRLFTARVTLVALVLGSAGADGKAGMAVARLPDSLRERLMGG